VSLPPRDARLVSLRRRKARINTHFQRRSAGMTATGQLLPITGTYPEGRYARRVTIEPLESTEAVQKRDWI